MFKKKSIQNISLNGKGNQGLGLNANFFLTSVVLGFNATYSDKELVQRM